MMVEHGLLALGFLGVSPRRCSSGSAMSPWKRPSEGHHSVPVQIGMRYGMALVHRLGGDVLCCLVLGLL